MNFRNVNGFMGQPVYAKINEIKLIKANLKFS